MGVIAHKVALPPSPPRPVDHDRTRWLDGVRFAAAMFVVIHHCWLWSFPGFPRNTGPAYLGWMLYGHLAVVIFIVVSGYSLTIAPARGGFRLKGGVKTFGKRRAWRILPPYWAALIFSIVIFVILHPEVSDKTVAKSFIVHGLLLQDIIGSPSPNGAFWSIAVEAQIYLIFPLMLMLWRRYGPFITASSVLIVASVLEVSAHQVHWLARYDNLTPQLAVDFAFGMVAAASTQELRFRDRRIPTLGISAALCAMCIIAINLIGSQTIVAQYYSVDIVVGAITALVFRGLATTDTSRLKNLLQSRAMVKGGTFSYSIYLVHVLALDLIATYVVQPLGLSRVAMLWMLLLLVIPGALVLSYAFFLVFERPYLNARSTAALRVYVDAYVAIRSRVRRLRPARQPAREPTVVGEAALGESPGMDI